MASGSDEKGQVTACSDDVDAGSGRASEPRKGGSPHRRMPVVTQSTRRLNRLTSAITAAPAAAAISTDLTGSALM